MEKKIKVCQIDKSDQQEVELYVYSHNADEEDTHFLFKHVLMNPACVLFCTGMPSDDRVPAALRVGKCRSGSPTVYTIAESKDHKQFGDFDIIAIDSVRPVCRRRARAVPSPDKKYVTLRDSLVLHVSPDTVFKVTLCGKTREIKSVDTMGYDMLH
jgi:hypothetical protein